MAEELKSFPRMAGSYRMRFAVFILALAVRIAAIELTGAGTMTFGDAADYVNTAQSICVQHVYPERGNLPFFRAPGLPFFIAAVTACEPSRIRAVKYGLAVADALTVVVIVAIAQLVGTSPWIAALLAIFHPFFVAGVTDIRSEPLFMLLLTAAIWLVLRGRVVGAGVAVGLASLVRPTGLLCIPLLAAFAFVRAARVSTPASGRGREGGLKARAARVAMVLIAAAMVTLSPWVIRNFLRFHELIVVNDAGGFNMWRGTHPDMLATASIGDREAFAKASWTFETQTVAAAARLVDGRAKTPGSRNREWARMARENVRRDPGQAARDTVRKGLIYWRPWLHPAEHGPRAVAVSFVIIAGLYLLGALGMFRHPDRQLVRATLVFFFVLWAAHLPYLSGIRIRMPLTDPLLIVFAAGAFSGWRRTADADGDSRSRSASP